MFRSIVGSVRLKAALRRARRACAAIRTDRLEQLESRALLSVTFRFDYRYDKSGYFRDPARRAVLELAGHLVADRIDSHLEAIRPTARRSWTTKIRNPEANRSVILKNPKIAADEIIVYPGATKKEQGEDQLELEKAKVGVALTVPDVIQTVKGTSAWKRSLMTRGLVAPGDDIAPRIVSIVFTRGYAFNFSPTTEGLNGSNRDFLTTAVHELGHALGFGISDAFNRLRTTARPFSGGPTSWGRTRSRRISTRRFRCRWKAGRRTEATTS